MRLASFAWVVPLGSVLIFGCSDGTATSGSGDAGPAAKEIRFDTAKYTVMSGEEKRYFCYTRRLPADKKTIIEEVAPVYGKGTHHLDVYYTLQAEPDGAFDCPEFVKDTWLPLYVGGRESGNLKAPDGAAFYLAPGTQVLVQLHLLNTSAAAIEDKATIVFKTTDDETRTPAGLYGFDYRGVSLPAHGVDILQQMSCNDLGRDMDVFAVLGHMHTRGKKIELSRGAIPGSEVLYAENYVYDNQPTVPMSFHVNKTDTLNLRCWYDNPDNVDVVWGESTANEMCSFVLYYTPFDTVGGCVK